jgi:trimethylamine--corrinoid protein Co-methyltransferase
MKSMIDVAGGREDGQGRPYALFDNCPVHGGRWEEPFVQNIIDCATAGFPVEFVSMPQPGLTCRPDLVEAISLHAAETLAGVVMVQVVRPGAPAIWGGSPMGVSLDYLTPSLAHTATFKMASATAQVGKRLGLPTHAYLGGGGNWEYLDHLTGGESALGIFTAALAGINVVSGIGMNRHEAGFDLLKLIADDYFCGLAQAIAQPIQGAGKLLPDTTTFDERIGQLLALRDGPDFFDPQGFLDTRGLGPWEKAGGPSTAMRLAKTYANLLASWEPPALSGRAKRSLYDIMASAFEACGGTREHVLTPDDVEAVGPGIA